MKEPPFRQLSETEVEAVLGRTRAGRVAYASGSEVELVPVQFIHLDGWIFGRAPEGADLRPAGESWWPAMLEVEERDGRHWRRVSVYGRLHLLPRVPAGWERELYRDAIARLKAEAPHARPGIGPRPETFFRIVAHTATGCECLLVAAEDASDSRGVA